MDNRIPPTGPRYMMRMCIGKKAGYGGYTDGTLFPNVLKELEGESMGKRNPVGSTANGGTR